MKTTTLLIRSAAAVAMALVPGMVQSSAAAGSAYFDKQESDANRQFKAYHDGPLTGIGEEQYQIMPPSYFHRKEGIPMYEAPRGGREY